MSNATRVIIIPCLFCDGHMAIAPSTGLFHCSHNSQHTFRHVDQQLAFWVDSETQFSMPQPLPLGLVRKPLGRPCLFCAGDMIPTKEKWHWMCNADFRLRMQCWDSWTFAQWDVGAFAAPRFELPKAWAREWGSDNAVSSK